MSSCNSNSNNTTVLITHIQDTIMDALDHLASAKEDLISFQNNSAKESDDSQHVNLTEDSMVIEKQELQDDIDLLRATKAKLLQDIARLKEEKEEAEGDCLVPARESQELLTQQPVFGEEINKKGDDEEEGDEPMYQYDDDKVEDDEEEPEEPATETTLEEFAFDNINMLEEENEVNETTPNPDAASLTTTSSGSTSTTSPRSVHSKSKQKRRASKAFIMSPKKWRRMMRSRRLQSILMAP